MKFCQREGQEDASQEQNDQLTLPGALIWIQVWGGGVGLWRLRPKTGSILLWQQMQQEDMMRVVSLLIRRAFFQQEWDSDSTCHTFPCSD